MILTDNEFKQIFPFSTPRENQRNIIEQILKAFIVDKKKYVIFCGPTGTGKSVIGYSIAKYFDNIYPIKDSSFESVGSYVLTSQKCLQEQYEKELQVPYILGRGNYRCKKNNNFTCQMGVCKQNANKVCKDCPYMLQRKLVLEQSEVGNMNYSYFLSSNAFHTIFDKNGGTVKSGIPWKTLLICDECHNISSELSKLGEIKITLNALKFLGINNLTLPMDVDTESNKIAWLIYTLNNQLLSVKAYLTAQIENYKKLNISREYKMTLQKFFIVERYLNVIHEIDIQTKKNQQIIIHSEQDSITYKILFCSSFFKTYMNNNAEFILFMSATVLNKNEFCKELGINPNDAVYISTESNFPIENRYIYFNPVGSMSYKEKNTTLPKMITEIKNIIEKYPNDKGIIHTVNYNIAAEIIKTFNRTKIGERLLMPQGDNRKDLLEKFMESHYPYVLISPSLTEGLDLKDDLSRFCIICKMPYMSLQDEWVKARMKINNMWYTNKACETLVQMTGRSVRSETDYCDTYILDKDFLNLARFGANIFPNWWKESVIMKNDK